MVAYSDKEQSSVNTSSWLQLRNCHQKQFPGNVQESSSVYPSRDIRMIPLQQTLTNGHADSRPATDSVSILSIPIHTQDQQQ